MTTYPDWQPHIIVEDADSWVKVSPTDYRKLCDCGHTGAVHKKDSTCQYCNCKGFKSEM